MELALIEVTDENASEIVRMALAQYANEPCRICGENVTGEDVFTNAVFAGYSENDVARSAHKTCWEKNIPQEQWVYAINAPHSPRP